MVQDVLVKLGWSGFSLIFVGIGLAMVRKGYGHRARSGRIAETETTHIRDIQPGTVEIKGTARPAEDTTLLESPIQRADALATHVTVEEWEKSGQSGSSWRTKHEERTALPMTVADSTGEVRVDLPEDGTLNVEQVQTEVGSGDEPPAAIRQYVQGEDAVDEASRHDIGPVSIGDRRRYSEGLIEPGEEVYVLGHAREEDRGWGEREYVIDQPTESGDFILSDKSEQKLIQEGKGGGLILLAFGGVFTVVGALFTIIPWVLM